MAKSILNRDAAKDKGQNKKKLAKGGFPLRPLEFAPGTTSTQKIYVSERAHDPLFISIKNSVDA